MIACSNRYDKSLIRFLILDGKLYAEITLSRSKLGLMSQFPTFHPKPMVIQSHLTRASASNFFRSLPTKLKDMAV
jgi:hypothetical protein